MVGRHHLPAHDGPRLLLPGGHHGPGGSAGAFVEAIEHPGRLVCTEVLQEALGHYDVPEIFNTDQGAQFTCDEFTGLLRAYGIAISRDGRGRWMDNVFIERLWRSVKYEEVYLKAYENIPEARENWPPSSTSTTCGVGKGLEDRTPDEVYWSTLRKQERAA